MRRKNWKILIDEDEAHLMCTLCVDQHFTSGELAPINNNDDGCLILGSFRDMVTSDELDEILQKHHQENHN